MSESKYKYEFYIEIMNESMDLIIYLYKALLPDLKRETGDPLTKIELIDQVLKIYIASDSQAKFIGILNTLIRLINLLSKIYYTKLVADEV